MTDMGIDVTTGLPYLPPDQFWRVGSYHGSDYHNGVLNKGPYSYVDLVERVEQMVSYDRFVMGVYFGKKAPVKVMTVNTVATQPLWNPDKKVPANHSGWSVVIDLVRYLPVPEEEIKPEFILAAAQKAKAWYDHKMEAVKLLGDYPPNVLPTIQEKN